MAIVVHKYGGSSVATPELLCRVADRVVACCERGDQPVVVVSAMGKTTDALVELAQQVSDGSHRREMDMILTAGERISMALLAMAIEDRGQHAISLTGSQAGIITTTDHNQARIIEVRPVRVHEGLEAGKVVIVGGFAGVSTDKEVTTLGRGGSDTTAIALAAALPAERCEIFSDVQGVYTADPRVVPEARPLESIAHGELLEFGLRGAGVLAPEAIDFARRHGIAIHARSSFNEGRGTVVTSAPKPGTGRAVGVTSDAAVVAVRLRGPIDAIEELMARIDDLGLQRNGTWLDRDGDLWRGLFLLDARNSPDAAEVVEQAGAALRAPEGWLEVVPGVGTVSVVGEGIAEQASCWRIAHRTLAKLGVRPTAKVGTAWGITAVVPADRLDDVVRAWHAAFPGLA